MPQLMFALSFGFAVVILLTHNAFAASNCAERSVVINELASKYHESRRAMGLAGGDGLMEIFASPETGTWTLTVTTPDGTTCLVASGTEFEAVTQTVPAPGEPA